MNNNNAKVVITEAFLELPEIHEMISKYKHVGLVVAIRMQLILSRYKHCIGRISHLSRFTGNIGVQLKTLLKIMDDCCAFEMDYDHDIYYMPRLRKKNHLSVKLTAEEIDDICNNGNVYFGYGENRNDDARDSENTSKTFRKGFQNKGTQNADNQDKCISSYKDRDKCDKDKSKDVRKDDALKCSDAAADDFKEILSSHSWRRSVKKRHGINLDDEHVLGIFAQWLYEYCCSNDKTLKGKSDLRQYANNLLRKGSKTRAEFDEYYDDALTEKSASSYLPGIQQNNTPAAYYEHKEKGVRYSCEGQIIPDEAPLQPSPGMAFSYIRDVWIPIQEYDAIPETEAFDRKRQENPCYIKRLGGEVW